MPLFLPKQAGLTQGAGDQEGSDWGDTGSFRTTDDVLLDLGAGFISVLTE